MIPPAALQATVGCVASGCWNWSKPVAVNCCVAPPLMLAVPGVTTMLSKACLTITVTLNVAELLLAAACST